MGKMTVGAKLRQARKDADLTQEQLAEHMGKLQDTISKYERGELQISIKDLPKFAQVLAKPIGYFFDEEIPDGELMTIFNQLPSEKQQQVLEYAKLLFQQQSRLPITE